MFRLSPSRSAFLFLVAPLLTLLASPALAVINVGLQPYDLFTSRYRNVCILTIESINAPAGTLVCKVSQSLKGTTFQPGQTPTLSFTDGMNTIIAAGVEKNELFPGKQIVVFAGRRRAASDLMLYADNFYLGSMVDPQNWKLDRSGDKIVGVDGEAISTLQGTWNGATDQLIRMLTDIVADRDHFPRKAYARFQEDILIDQFEQPAQGLALYDIEGDGDQDIIACSPAGDRIYLQNDGMVFVNATSRFGLDTKSRSCSLADVNADGLVDLLTGVTIHLGKFEANTFQFIKTEVLPADLATHLKSASFVELNGDGWPDLVVSIAGGGLRTFLNDAKPEGTFTEATSAMGLDRPECGPTADGYFAPGDWNGDLRMDLFYAADRGYFLVQNEQGVFQPQPHDIAFKFTSGAEDRPGLTGASVFLPLLAPDRMDLIVPLAEGWLTIANRDGKPQDVTRWGNEISEGSNDHLATVAEDFNLDGHIDFYTISSAPNGHNRLIVNRGYGSFMLASIHKNYEHMFKGPSEQLGGLAVVAGDVNNDGMPDLLLANPSGHLVLILNDTLAVRAETQHPPREIAQLQNVRLLSVRPMGHTGLTNARIRVYDDQGQLVARRDLGLNVAAGCYGPDLLTLILRWPGIYKVKVEFADGLVRSEQADLTEKQRVTLNIDRGDKTDDGVW